MDGVAVVEVGDVAHARQAASRGKDRRRRSRRREVRASGDSQGSSSDDSTTSSSGQTNRAASQGSASAVDADGRRDRSATSRPGKGKSTFAQTPSPRPGEAPSTAGEPLRQPALDAAGRHGDELRLHRVVERAS